MLPFLIVIIIFGPLLYYVAVYRDKKKREVWESKYPPYRPSSSLGMYSMRVANIRYQCNRDDIGAVIVAVKADPDNSYHADSMSVIRDDGKLMGFVAKREATRFNRWSGRDVCSGVGMILYDEPTHKLWADIHVFRPDTTDEQVEAEMHRFLQWVEHAYGADYIPERYR